MMETEGAACLNGPATAANDGVTQRLKGHTGRGLRVLYGDPEGISGRKDGSEQHLFVYQKRLGHILDKAFALGQQNGLKGLPD
jgi:hypothetical protein